MRCPFCLEGALQVGEWMEQSPPILPRRLSSCPLQPDTRASEPGSGRRSPAKEQAASEWLLSLNGTAFTRRRRGSFEHLLSQTAQLKFSRVSK